MSNERRASGALDLRDELLRLAVDAFTEHAFVTLAPDGIVTSWNVGAERSSVIARDAAVGVHVSTIFTPHDRRDPAFERRTCRTPNATVRSRAAMGGRAKTEVGKCVNAHRRGGPSAWTMCWLRGRGA